MRKMSEAVERKSMRLASAATARRIGTAAPE
jgi:hypothetical protein